MIEVRINKDMITATFCMAYLEYWHQNRDRDTMNDSPIYSEWKNLKGKKFEIDFSELEKMFKAMEEAVGGKIVHANIGYNSGEYKQAEILPNGKIKIL